VLVGALFYSLRYRNEVKIVERHTTDTLIIVKHDTIVKYKPKYIKERVVDSVKVYVKDLDKPISFPRTQRYFSEPNLYDLWVSGYDPQIDSLKFYPKIEYRTITNTNTKEVYPQRWKLYLGGGFDAISGTFIPKLSLMVAPPKKWGFGAEIGYYDKNVVYGLRVYYNILEK
jgi:hypothetical protein